jgi:hypothetical protein
MFFEALLKHSPKDWVWCPPAPTPPEFERLPTAESELVHAYGENFWERTVEVTSGIDNKAGIAFGLAATFLGLLISENVAAPEWMLAVVGALLLVASITSLVSFFPKQGGRQPSVQDVNQCLLDGRKVFTEYKESWQAAEWSVKGSLHANLAKYYHKLTFIQWHIIHWKARQLYRAGFLIVLALIIGSIGIAWSRYQRGLEAALPTTCVQSSFIVPPNPSAENLKGMLPSGAGGSAGGWAGLGCSGGDPTGGFSGCSGC